ncbi:putative ATP synthase subunit C [Hyperthermus butylicus DSM 5456]|uniref:ATP synthase subunit C n=2 Tax=Hyperthermus butylicus TaxID=54248 RepID=A2BKX2_HYPBU|nr:putative ATP synthase subunit C [Hyperthermus butylicus DSM 5456]
MSPPNPQSGAHAMRRAVLGLVLFTALSLLAATTLVAAAQEDAVAAAEAAAKGWKAIAAALAMGLSAIGAGIALGRTGSAASAAVAEKPEVSGKLLIYLVLGEGIAIYGLLVAILIIFTG